MKVFRENGGFHPK